MNNRRLFLRCAVWSCVAILTISGCGSPQGGDIAKLDSGTASGGQTTPQGSGGKGGSGGVGSGGSIATGGSTAAGGDAGTTTNDSGNGGSTGPDGGRRDG